MGWYVNVGKVVRWGYGASIIMIGIIVAIVVFSEEVFVPNQL